MRFYVVKSKIIKYIALMFCMLAVLSINWGGQGALASVFFNRTYRKIPIYCVETSEKVVAISFDAAWGSDKTQDILDILKEYDIPATFFLVGMWVDKYPEMVKKIDEQNIEIGTHSNLHPDLSKLSRTQVDLELSTSVKKIEDITSKKVTLFRAPFGAYNNTVISSAEDLGLSTIQWDVDSLDWKGISAKTITSNILKKAQNGSIILCHNNSDHIVEALPSIILSLKSRGYKFVSIGELIYKEDFRIDSAGKQIKN